MTSTSRRAATQRPSGSHAAVRAGLIPEPDKDRRARVRYTTTRKEGVHQLRHHYASVMLAGGVSINELAEYLGHADPAFTLRVYAHLLPSSHDRARAVINERFTRMNADPGSLTLKRQVAENPERLTEQRRNRLL
jgi:integrase